MQKNNTEQIKALIIRRSAEEFAQNDYARVKLQNIANAAGISRGPLYYHFNNKEELFAATVNMLISEQRSSYEKVLSKKAPIIDILREEYIQCISYNNTLLQTMKNQPELQKMPQYQEFSRWLYNRKLAVFFWGKGTR